MTDVSLAPIVALIEPTLVYTASAIATAAVPYALYLARKYLHLQVSAQAQATLQAAAATEAGKLVAAASDNLANRQVDIGSVIVTKATDDLIHRAPQILVDAGVTQVEVDHLIAGEIGKLQAYATAAVQAPAPTPVK